MGMLGIVAGGGDLPFAIAQSVHESGGKVFVVALRGLTDPWVEDFAHEWTALGELGKALKYLHANKCDPVLLAGRVARPKWNALKLDARGALMLPKVIKAAAKGDDALLRMFVELFESEGFKVCGVAQAAPGLLATEGTITARKPDDANNADIALGIKVVRTLGALDVGQAVAVCDGLVLAVEAAEGTDLMIERVAAMPDTLRGQPGKLRGVLVKALKPVQDGKTDLPVIGVATVERVVAAGLAGIAVEAGRSLIVNRSAVIAAADKAGVFVTGFASDA